MPLILAEMVASDSCPQPAVSFVIPVKAGRTRSRL
jgi:hypothetical protein